jgi:hypothetical protein
MKKSKGGKRPSNNAKFARPAPEQKAKSAMKKICGKKK